jgi:hypothetical protein
VPKLRSQLRNLQFFPFYDHFQYSISWHRWKSTAVILKMTLRRATRIKTWTHFTRNYTNPILTSVGCKRKYLMGVFLDACPKFCREIVILRLGNIGPHYIVARHGRPSMKKRANYMTIYQERRNYSKSGCGQYSYNLCPIQSKLWKIAYPACFLRSWIQGPC